MLYIISVRVNTHMQHCEQQTTDRTKGVFPKDRAEEQTGVGCANALNLAGRVLQRPSWTRSSSQSFLTLLRKELNSPWVILCLN